MKAIHHLAYDGIRIAQAHIGKFHLAFAQKGTDDRRGHIDAVEVRLEQGMEMKWGMMNIGTRPTFGGKRTTIETHIFHFDGDIYGQLLLVSFVHRIRGERKFESPEELAEQLREDEETVVALLQKDKENE